VIFSGLTLTFVKQFGLGLWLTFPPPIESRRGNNPFRTVCGSEGRVVTF